MNKLEQNRLHPHGLLGRLAKNLLSGFNTVSSKSLGEAETLGDRHVLDLGIFFRFWSIYLYIMTCLDSGGTHSTKVSYRSFTHSQKVNFIFIIVLRDDLTA